MNNNEIIVVKQLPVITEQLRVIKEQVTGRVNDALSLACTEDTRQAVKNARAELNAEYKFWEEKRKEVKKAILSPYEMFEAVYKVCISDVFKKADVELKAKIDVVETVMKEEKAQKIRDYFAEYLASKNITMPLTFECANINVTLSASEKSLKEQAKAFIDRVCDDLNLIDTQEHKDEILYYYGKVDGGCYLNASRTIQLVNEKYKAIEDAKKREEERKAKEEAEKAAVEKVEDVVEILAPPTVEAPAVEEKTYTLSFKVKGTKAQLKALKEFLNNGGYDYE